MYGKNTLCLSGSSFFTSLHDLTLNQISYLLLKLENVTETAMKLVAAKIRNLVIKN
jgi:hypothetical protein